MKKATLIITAVLACAILCYAAYVWTLVDNYPYKIWLYRCNSIEKLHEKEHRYPNIEVDICLRAGGVMDVTHDLDTTFHLGIEPYMKYLGEHPERHMWMDVKNLSEDNQLAFKFRLDSLVMAYGVSKSQLNIESPQWQRLFLFCSAPVEPLPRTARQRGVTPGHGGPQRLRACPVLPGLLVQHPTLAVQGHRYLLPDLDAPPHTVRHAI